MKITDYLPGCPGIQSVLEEVLLFDCSDDISLELGGESHASCRIGGKREAAWEKVGFRGEKLIMVQSDTSKRHSVSLFPYPSPVVK